LSSSSIQNQSSCRIQAYAFFEDQVGGTFQLVPEGFGKDFFWHDFLTILDENRADHDHELTLLWDVQKALPATQCMGASNQCYCISL
jgi:hypothetical protein